MTGKTTRACVKLDLLCRMMSLGHDEFSKSKYCNYRLWNLQCKCTLRHFRLALNHWYISVVNTDWQQHLTFRQEAGRRSRSQGEQNALWTVVSFPARCPTSSNIFSRWEVIGGLFHWQFFFTRGQFWPSDIVVACICLSIIYMFVCVCQSWACMHDNSLPIKARITKFGTEVQNTLVKIPIVLGRRLTVTCKVKFNL